MFVLYTNSVSAHQLPLARELAKRLGEENFRYVYTGENLQRGNQEVATSEPWIIHLSSLQPSTSDLLLSCGTLLVGGIYPVELMERRLAAGKQTLYMSERWFKPVPIGVGGRCRCRLPGWIKLLHPGYFRRAWRFAKMVSDPNCWYLPIGPWAAKDMRLVLRIVSLVTFHRYKSANAFIPWGYFVEPSKSGQVTGEDETSGLQTFKHSSPIRILWVGRMLDWKRVDTIVRAVALANGEVQANSSCFGSLNAESQTSSVKPLNSPAFSLTLVGDGPERPRLEALTRRLFPSAVDLGLRPRPISFHPPVSLGEVRALMRQHDVYVLASNAQEGWGAALSEALSEGMMCVGTCEAGASAALLPKANLFHAGDYGALAGVLLGEGIVGMSLPYAFTPCGAAGRIVKMIDT